MKKSSLLIFAVFVSVFAAGQQRVSKKKMDLQQTVVNMFEALSDRDSVALRSYCIPDVTFYEYGQIWDLDTVIRKAILLNQSADFKRINTFHFIHVDSDKTSAWLTYELTSVITRDSKETVMQWLETVILAREGKEWKVKHLHSTLIRRE